MARGECEEGRESLIDFELKQLRGDPIEPAEPPTLVSADMAREAERKQWEAAAAAATSSGGEGGGGRSASEKRLHHELSEETEQGRSSALDQKLKRQRALEERQIYLPYISPTSPLHLPYISPASPGAASDDPDA